MKCSILTLIALASVVIAGPPEKEHKPERGIARPGEPCKPVSYACLKEEGWLVCNDQGKYVFAGNCPPKTVCRFYKPSMSPYCVPPNFQFP